MYGLCLFRWKIRASEYYILYINSLCACRILIFKKNRRVCVCAPCVFVMNSVDCLVFLRT